MIHTRNIDIRIELNPKLWRLNWQNRNMAKKFSFQFGPLLFALWDSK